jgi:hypothetical protein
LSEKVDAEEEEEFDDDGKDSFLVEIGSTDKV